MLLSFALTVAGSRGFLGLCGMARGPSHSPILPTAHGLPFPQQTHQWAALSPAGQHLAQMNLQDVQTRAYNAYSNL